MARITIASLQSTITALEAQLAEVTRERDSLLVAQRPSRQTAAPAPRSHDAERPVSDFRARCAAARELAMRTGAVVRMN